MHTMSVRVAICAITVVLTSSGRLGTRVKMSFGGTRREHACLDALHDGVQPLNLLLGRQIIVLRLRGVRVESLVRHVRNCVMLNVIFVKSSWKRELSWGWQRMY